MVALAAAVGCTQSEPAIGPEILAAHRERFILAEEPDGVVDVMSARQLLTGSTQGADAIGPPEATGTADADSEHSPVPASSESATPQTVVVVGRIGGIPNPWLQARPDYPWMAGQAEFVIADAEAAAEIADHGHAHDDPDHDCPFCAEAANSDVLAVVRFKDPAGQMIPIDAKRLFDLKGEETVVVRGKAEMLGDSKTGVLVVDADGLFVRR
jgi:hypothetical protein